MKIAFLNIYGGKVERGAERAIHELANRLVTKNDITVYQLGKLKDTQYHLKQSPFLPIISTDVSKSKLLRILKKIYLDPYSLLVLFFSSWVFPQLIRNRHDIIVPVNGFWQVIVCKIASLLRGGKVIVLGYAGIGVDDFVNLKLSPDAFLPMTDVAKSWAKKVNPNIFIETLPGGVDLKTIRPNLTPMKLPLKKPIILTVAAFVPYKHIDLTIQAVAKLSHVSLVVAGHGPLQGKIQALGQKLLQDRFILLNVGFEELPALYCTAQVFSLASNHSEETLFSKLTNQEPSEAFGIVYVEAMAAGLPIVAPNDELRREIIGPAGILVNCTDIEAYAQALNLALSKRWGEVPRNRAKKYDWDRIATRLETLLNQIYIS